MLYSCAVFCQGCKPSLFVHVYKCFCGMILFMAGMGQGTSTTCLVQAWESMVNRMRHWPCCIPRTCTPIHEYRHADTLCTRINKHVHSLKTYLYILHIQAWSCLQIHTHRTQVYTQARMNAQSYIQYMLICMSAHPQTRLNVNRRTRANPSTFIAWLMVSSLAL